MNRPGHEVPGRAVASASGLDLLLVAVALLVPAILFGLAALQNRADVLREGRDVLVRSTAVLQEHAGKVMQTQELALALVGDRIRGLTEEQVAAPEISDFLAGLRAPLDQAVSIWITDADGVVRAGSQAWNPATRITDRDFFTVHRDHRRGPYVSAAFVGRATALPSFALSRRRETGDGTFAGTIHIALRPTYFARFFAEAAPALPHRALLLRAEGDVLASEPSGGLERLPPDGPLMGAFAAAPGGGVFEAASPVDGRRYLYAYAPVADYPLYVALGIPTQALLKRWRDNLRLFGAVAAAASALLLAASWLAMRRAAAERAALARLRAALDDLRRETEGRAAAESRVRQAQRMEALGQLAGGVAHDVNNVLQAVASGARMMLRKPEDAPQVRRLAGMVLEATERGAAVARRLLAFARQGELRAADVAAGPLLEDLREVLTHTLGAGVTVHIQVAPGLPTLRADKGQLETVLVNLATNARDAMAGTGGGVLTLAAVPEEVAEGVRHPAGLLPGHYVRLGVADTGSGMDAATLARAAEPFFTTKPAGSGTGLGLAMAKGFAEQSGGGFAIRSAPGAGTTVTLWLPRSVAAADAVLADQAAAPEAEALPSPRVLLVEDETLVRETLAAELVLRGWRVSAAADGPEALRQLDAGLDDLDLLVTDQAMPGMNGLALLRQARLRRPRLPGILLTGLVGDGPETQAGLAEAVRDGPFALLRKPADAAELAARAAALLRSEGRA
ncbi:hybrid sensor histidine kinase/response regulator [Falsiroseomonas bella]|nr:hybrid sensor histidine kinase/response regulator [Falsiroseomonas bella]